MMNEQAAGQTQAVIKPTFTPIISGLLQRQCACGQHTSIGGECEECKKKRENTLQRASISPALVPDVPPIVHEVLHSSGQPLDAATRSVMEPRFGHDFSSVRVHTDAKAAASAQAVNALAYTVGRDVVFGEGQYAAQSNAGRKLIAHELTHVIQQGTTVWNGGTLAIGAPDTAQEVEAQHAEHGDSAHSSADGATTSAAVGTIQRQSSDVGNLFVRVREDGRIEFLYGTPDLPVTGPLGVGIRCQNGRCQFVGGQNPGDITHDTYTLQEALDLLRGRSGSRSTVPPLSLCLPGQQIPGLSACCPAGMMWDGTMCAPMSITMPGRPSTPSPIQTPQLTLPSTPLSIPRTPRVQFGTIEGSTYDSFASDSSSVPAQHSAALDHLASLLNIYREVEVHIEGHTDSTASEAHNERLSRERAEAIKAALTDRGVENPARLLTTGFGERQLRVRPERTDADKAANRRVEVWFHIPPTPRLGDQFRLQPPLGQ